MNDFITESVFFGAAISLFSFWIGSLIKKKLKLGIFNPLLIAIILTIIFLKALNVDYETYNSGAKYISYLLTPATVALAVPLYEQLEVLKKDYKAILAGIGLGSVTAVACVFILSLAFGLDHANYASLLPKSITTAIGMSLSEEMGGYTSVTVAAIVITGVIGNVLAEPLCKLLHITEPVAKGVAIGTASHALGTSKAVELGEVEGAISGLSIVVCGLLTVVWCAVMSSWI